MFSPLSLSLCACFDGNLDGIKKEMDVLPAQSTGGVERERGCSFSLFFFTFHFGIPAARFVYIHIDSGGTVSGYLIYLFVVCFLIFSLPLKAKERDGLDDM
jgi:hypothetical protein